MRVFLVDHSVDEPSELRSTAWVCPKQDLDTGRFWVGDNIAM
jgi:hypothetical protein